MHAETLFSQAAKAYRLQDFDAALQVCETLLAQPPAAGGLPAILNLKALSLAGKGLMFAAADCLERAIHIQPGDALLRHHAARILLELGRFDAARREAEQACQLAPGRSGYRYHLAVVCQLQGDSRRARELAQQCVSEDASLFEAWILLSELAVESGEPAQAAACLREILQQDAGHAAAWALLAAMGGEAAADRSAQRALEEIKISARDDASAATAGFALADMARRCGDHAAAFALYRQANEYLATAHPFAMDDWELSLDKTISASRVWLESGSSAAADADTNGGERLVFVVGMPRSGTSLCEQIACSHPGVMGGGEMATMEYIANTLAYENTDPFNLEAEPDWLPRMRGAYLDSLPAGSAAYDRISDKTPRNFERLGLILRLFPAARVLWCVRHPLDTILSCFFQDFRSGQRFSYRLEFAARMYVGHVRVMRHWMRYFADSITVIDYAEMVQNPAATARQMALFIGLDFNPAMLQPHLNPRPVRTASSLQVKQAIYTTSLNNWRHYRQELAAVSAMLQQQGLLDKQWRSTVLAGAQTAG
jgi:tetratricopeptide (TPR) repeat protein